MGRNTAAGGSDISIGCQNNKPSTSTQLNMRTSKAAVLKQLNRPHSALNYPDVLTYRLGTMHPLVKHAILAERWPVAQFKRSGWHKASLLWDLCDGRQWDDYLCHGTSRFRLRHELYLLDTGYFSYMLSHPQQTQFK